MYIIPHCRIRWSKDGRTPRTSRRYWNWAIRPSFRVTAANPYRLYIFLNQIKIPIQQIPTYQWYKVTYLKKRQIQLKRRWLKECQIKTSSSHHRFYIGGFEGGYQSLVIVDARLIHLADAVRQNSGPRDGETIMRHLGNTPHNNDASL